MQGVAGVVLESGNFGNKYLVKNTGFGVWANSHSYAFARIYRMKVLFRASMTAPRHRNPPTQQMTTPIIAGAGVAALALTGRAAILSFEAWRRAPPRMRKFYEGGFDPEMTKREAALILGVRESAAKDKVLAAHRKVMIANHPDAGGSDYIATKINEAKAKLIKKGGSGSPF